MKQIVFDDEYFNIVDTLNCGQIFRFRAFDDGFLVFSKDKACFLRQNNGVISITVNEDDENYFYRFFDLDRDYKKINDFAKSDGVEIVKKSAELGKGIRILNQDAEEMLFSFVISQNNNIPRIKKSIEFLCREFGRKKTFMGVEYRSFPTANELVGAELSQLKEAGLGYRAEYISGLACKIASGYSVESLKNFNTDDLRAELISLKGIGEKVANCVLLFGFNRYDSFPVDTWIEKVYKEDFLGEFTSRHKITAFFMERYKDYAGLIQQYLFYYKRSLEKR